MYLAACVYTLLLPAYLTVCVSGCLCVYLAVTCLPVYLSVYPAAYVYTLLLPAYLSTCLCIWLPVYTLMIHAYLSACVCIWLPVCIP